MIESLFLPPDVSGLIAALAIGLLIGLERGWNDRELPEGSRVAGLRTFTLTGCWVIYSQTLGLGH